MTTPLVVLTQVTDLVTLGAVSRRDRERRAAAAHLHREAERQAAAELELFRASDLERFVVALAAPFREAHALELQAAARDGRSAPTLQVITLPGRASWWERPLRHDFGVSDAAGAELAVGRLVAEAEEVAAASPERATYLAAQAAHVATAAAALGYLSRPRALDLARRPAGLVAELHADWTGYARAFLLGERACSPRLRAIVFSQVVGRLRTDARSPWRSVEWAPTGLVLALAV